MHVDDAVAPTYDDHKPALQVAHEASPYSPGSQPMLKYTCGEIEMDEE
jgi:hypothetical protein